METVSKDIYKLMTRIEKYYDVSIEIKPRTFFNSVDDAGCAICDESKIFIRRDMLIDRKSFLCTTIHEVCHILCYRQDKFKLYHSPYLPKNLTKSERLIVYRTGLKAERYVDKMAKLELKLWDKRIKYDLVYYDSGAIESFRNGISIYNK